MSFLNKEYPFVRESHWLRDCLGWGIVVFLILYLLQPFGFSLYEGNKLMVSFMFGVVTFVCCVTYEFGVFRTMRKYLKVCKVWHMGLALLGIVLFNGVCNWLYFSYVFLCPLTWGIFLQFMRWAFIFGAIITSISLFASYNHYLREQIETLKSNNEGELMGINITLHDQNLRESDLHIPLNNLLYVEAKKNNVAVCYLEEEKVVSKVLHTTLSTVEEALAQYENVIRCHRSFLVNLNQVASAQGNSNGYQLTLAKCHSIIPVSRSYVPKLRQHLA